MSRWKRNHPYLSESATVRRGQDECTATVHPVGFARGFGAVAVVNPMSRDPERRGGWSGPQFHILETAKREALRACGRMLRRLRG